MCACMLEQSSLTSADMTCDPQVLVLKSWSSGTSCGHATAKPTCSANMLWRSWRRRLNKLISLVLLVWSLRSLTEALRSKIPKRFILDHLWASSTYFIQRVTASIKRFSLLVCCLESIHEFHQWEPFVHYERRWSQSFATEFEEKG
jgi:hypothetical protein